MKTFSCKSLGFNDDWCCQAKTDDRLLERVAMHLREEHDMKALSPETLGTIRNSFCLPSYSDNAAAVDLVFQKYNCEGDPDCTWRYIVEAEKLIGCTSPLHEGDLVGIGLA